MSSQYRSIAKKATQVAVASIFALNCGSSIAQFSTIINVPPNIGNNESIGSDTQVNISTEGQVGHFFTAGNADGTSTNIEVNVLGGSIGNFFTANRGSVTTLEAGYIGPFFRSFGEVNVFDGSIIGIEALDGSVINIAGGRIFQSSAFDGSVVNLSGGFIDNFIHASFQVFGGSVINVTGGLIGNGLQVPEGSEINFSGGIIGFGFDAQAGSEFNIYGGEFRLNGEPIAGLNVIGDSRSVDLDGDWLLSGTLSDGTPFGFSSQGFDTIADGTLTLHATELPDVVQTNINVPGDPAPAAIRSGQTLTLDDGGFLTNHFNAGAGSTFIMTGGQLGDYFESVGANVTITGGQVGRTFRAYAESEVNISGGGFGDSFGAFNGSRVSITNGSFLQNFQAHSGSEVNIAGGTFDNLFKAFSGSVVSISGGAFGPTLQAGGELYISGGLLSAISALDGGVVSIAGGAIGDISQAHPGSDIRISGGTISGRLNALSGSSVSFHGGEFRLDGVVIPGLDIEGAVLSLDLPAGKELSGTLTDGTPFAVTSQDGDMFANGTLTLVVTELPEIGPSQIVVPSDPAPTNIREGQTLVIGAGGAIGTNFRAGYGSQVSVAGGQIGTNFHAIGAAVAVSGGTIAPQFEAYFGTIVNVSGGSVGTMTGCSECRALTAYAGSVVNISGGSIGSRFVADAGSEVNLSAGSIGERFTANGGTVNISGGSVGQFFAIGNGSVVNISGGATSGQIQLTEGGTLNVREGANDIAFIARANSIVNVLGGTVTAPQTFNGSIVNVAGGEVGLFDALGGTITIFGTDFVLDNVNITSSLTQNSPYTISARNVLLSGNLADGEFFDFALNSTRLAGQDFFASTALLNIVLVLPGDFNSDGIVDAADYVVWRKTDGTPEGYNAWRANFGRTVGGGSGAIGGPRSEFLVPEPFSSALALMALTIAALGRRAEPSSNLNRPQRG